MSYFDELVPSLEAEGAATRSMFGHRCLTVVRKGFAIDFEGDLVVKLRAPEHAAALALAGSHLFDPMGQRPMKEWVQIPAAHAARWPEFAAAAMSYVADLHS